MTTALSALLALGAAALFGVSSVLQQTAARGVVDVPLVGVRVVRQLLHHPRWLLAVSLAGLSFGVQAAALAFGPLVLVQPLAGTDLLFALPFLVRRQRRRLGRREWSAAGMVVAGVGVFLAVSPPSAGSIAPPLSSWVWVLGAGGGVVALTVPVALGSTRILRTALLAGAGAVVFAVGDALTKAAVGQFGVRGLAVLASWEPYALLVVGLSGMVLAQGAFRSGSLLTSLPIIDTIEPVGAVVIGATVFSERIGGSAGVLAVQLFAGAVAVTGIVLLDRSPLVAVTAEDEATPPVGGRLICRCEAPGYSRGRSAGTEGEGGHVGESVEFSSNGGTAGGYLARPAGGSGPGVVVVQEWWGLDDSLKIMVDRLAEGGFVALAPDLFHGEVADHEEPDKAAHLMQSLPPERAARDMGAAVDFLDAHEAVAGKGIGVVGFCMGGMLSLHLAAQRGDKVTAVVPFYGYPSGDQEPDWSGMTAAVRGHMAEQDDFFGPQGARELEAKLQGMGKDCVITIHPAGHAFMNPQNALGTSDPELAAKVWPEVLAFLHQRLDG